MRLLLESLAEHVAVSLGSHFVQQYSLESSLTLAHDAVTLALEIFEATVKSEQQRASTVLDEKKKKRKASISPTGHSKKQSISLNGLGDLELLMRDAKALLSR